MSTKKSNGIKATAQTEGAVATGAQAPEADFNDTIARNRSLKLVDLAAMPHPPTGFRATDPGERKRRIRWLSSDHRAEAVGALREAGTRDLRAELGQFAPEPQRGTMLADRVTHSGELVARAEKLLAYAKEADQIAMSDALQFLEAEQKQYLNAVEHNDALELSYQALVKVFAMRSGAIAEGIAQAQAKVTAAPVDPAAGGK
ncbi:MAG: hypothetical protein ABJE95_11165 [Byssovorax sp.]